jgi:hypothetical protein
MARLRIENLEGQAFEEVARLRPPPVNRAGDRL